jgi:hypothetical protein
MKHAFWEPPLFSQMQWDEPADRIERLENGQGLLEYILILMLTVITAVMAMALTGISLRDAYCQIVEGFGSRACVFVPEKWTKISGNWDVGDQICGGVGEGRLFADGFSGSDYTIHIDSAALTQGNGYGVFFRATDPANIDGYTFQYDPGYQAFIFRKWVNGRELNPPFAVSRAPGYNWYNASHQVQIKIQGDHFTAYVDGAQVLEATDSTYASGGIGLRTWDNTKMCVDGITINEH